MHYGQLFDKGFYQHNTIRVQINVVLIFIDIITELDADEVPGIS